MKRTVCAILALIMAISASGMLSFATSSAGITGEDEIISVLGALEIMNGDGYGNLNLESNVTRAEFTKMLVCASLHKDDARAGVATSPFPDVRASHWAAPYVKIATSTGVVSGYLDGTFRPDRSVTLEEAVTLVLRMLGYTDADFKGAYPDGQLAKYYSTDLDMNISAQKGDALTRRQCMHLLYNMLCADTKDGRGYASTLGYSSDSHGRIDSESVIEKSKSGPYIVTDVSRISADTGISPERAVIYKDDGVISYGDIKAYDVLYYSKGLSTIWVYSDKVAGTVDSFSPDRANPSSVIVSGTSYTVSNGSQAKSFLSGKGGINTGEAIALILNGEGEAVYAARAQGPFINKQISTENIYVNGTLKDSYAAESSDLVYVCPDFMSVWYYTNNISGIAEQILPSVENPEKIVIGGKTYSLGKNAAEKFKDEKELSQKDFVTAYVRDNTVEYVLRADKDDPSIYEDNNLNYAAMVEATLKGPVIVTDGNWKEGMNTDSDTAYYNGSTRVSADSIKIYDVLYYSNAFDSVWIYSDKATGTLEEILPDSASPTSVKVAGATYNLETAASAISLSNGSYKRGDVVTLLLGKDGKVARIISADELANEFFGISLGTQKKEYKGADGKTSEAYYVNISSFDGGTYSIAVSNDDITAGTLVKVKFENGKQKVTKYNGTYSTVSKVTSAIKNGKIASDATIIDYYGTSYLTLAPAKLSVCKINTDTVKYYDLDDDGNIAYLILADASGEMHSYGVIMEQKENYTLFSSSKTQNMSNSTTKTGAVQIKYNGGSVSKVTVLEELSNVTLSDSTVKSGKEESPIWDYVECFSMKRKNFEIDKDATYSASDYIKSISLDYLRSLAEDGARIFAYRDSTGVVRVLIAI